VIHDARNRQNTATIVEPAEARVRVRIMRGVSEYREHIGLFSRNAWLYLLGAFLMGANFEIFQLLLNLYLKELGFHESSIGLVNSSRAVGMTVIAIPAALALSRIRLKTILIAAGVTFVFFSYFIVSYNNLNLLLSFSVLAGMSYTFPRIAAAPFYMRNSTSKERMHLFSFSFGVQLLAGMTGSLGAGKLASFLGGATGNMVLGYRYTLYIAMFISLLALIPFSLIRECVPVEGAMRISLIKDIFRKRRNFYIRIAIAQFLVGAGAGLIIPFLNLYFRDRFGLTPAEIGVCYFSVVCAMFLGTMIGPILAKRYGRIRTIVVTQLASIPFMLTLAYTYLLPIAFVAFVMRGALMNIGVPIGTNFGMEMSKEREQGLVNALLMVSWNSSWMVAAAVGGRMIESYGYTVTLNVTVVLYVLSSLFYFWSFQHMEQRNENATGWVLVKEDMA
jgi:predicted MFS family arabinose efflux permease